MSQELSAGPISLVQLLKGEKEYISPLFQRQYVWQDKEINNLWDDIDEMYETANTSRFLGALVLEVKSAGKAFEPDSEWIVDGQQRITTLYLLLLMLAIECERNGENAIAATLFNQYLFNQDGNYKNSPKLSSTLLDYAQLNQVIRQVRSIEPQLKADFGASYGKLTKASELILSAIRKRCFEGGTLSAETTKKYITIILEKLKFVQIVLGDDQDAHQVFDSLNAKGIRLENKDLIRNLIFQKLADEPVRADFLYKGEWLPIESLLGERFDGYFFPFTLAHKPSATKSAVLSILRERWKTTEPAGIIEELKEFIAIYNALTSTDDDVRDNLTPSTEISLCLRRIYRMRAPTSIYPFVFRLLREYQKGTLTEVVVVHNLKLIESFLVRRSLAGFEPTGLHAVFKDLWSQTLGNPTKFIEVIDNNPTVQFPDDSKFENDIKGKSLYGRRLASYIILEYERGLDGGDEVALEECTIDHVMPQELTEAWRSVINEEDHKRVKDTWANLVPLSGPANSEKGQRPWEFSKEFFLTETVFKTTKRLAHTYQHWNLATIDERGNQLATWAKNRWMKG